MKPHRVGPIRVGLAVGLVALALTGCASRLQQQAADKTAQIPDDYRERHPIVLGDAVRSLDVFLVPNSGIDHRQAQDVKEFAKEYRSSGKGALVAALPAGAPTGAVQHTLREIRKVAASAGVPAGSVRVVSAPTHPTAASVRLSYAALSAQSSRCGDWPYDPTGASTLQSWANKPHYNLGCSYQSMMAAQVANPIDLVRSRPEGAYDIERRLQGIERVREGSSPATQWPTDSARINQTFQ